MLEQNITQRYNIYACVWVIGIMDGEMDGQTSRCMPSMYACIYCFQYSFLQNKESGNKVTEIVKSLFFIYPYRV